MSICIVFDIGGVVIEYDPQGYLAQHFPHNNTALQLYDAVFGSREWDLFDRGDLCFDEASQVFRQRGKALNLSREMEQVLGDAFAMLRTRTSMVSMMEKLHRQRVPLYYLSNMSPEVKNMLEKRAFWPLFSGGLASSDVGLLKPDPRFFQMILERYHLNAPECLFFDDTLQNVEAAQKLGIQAHHFTCDEVLRQAVASYGLMV